MIRIFIFTWTLAFSINAKPENIRERIIIEHIENQILNASGYETPTIKEKVQTNVVEVKRKRNLSILAKKNSLPKQEYRSGKEIVEAKKAQIRSELKRKREKERIKQETKRGLSKKPNSWFQKMRSREDQFYKKNLRSIANFLKMQRLAKIKYESEKINYVESLSVMDVPKEVASETVSFKRKGFKKVLSKKIIKNAFDVPIKNQGKRPTCSAFAAINAIEILSAQKGRNLDLSEQYFYWSSKPECHKKLCSSRGSWVGKGLEYSKNSNKRNLPTENNCPYNPDQKGTNDTQIPLAPGCFEGSAKVVSYKYTRDFREIIDAINNDKPVIAGTKLNQRFFENNGLVMNGESTQVFDLQNRLHSKGHAYNIIGYYKLPKKLKSKQGEVCFLVNNSWSEGWGFGGYACLTEEWVRVNLNKSPFIILESII